MLFYSGVINLTSYNNRSNVLLKRKSSFKFSIFILFIVIIFNLFQYIPINQGISSENRSIDDKEIQYLSSDGSTIMFQGIELPLNITDYGNLYKTNQKINLNNENELNLTYYLDEIHDWKVSKIENSISNIQDTRNWINNSDFLSTVIYKNDTVIESPHNYLPNQGWPSSAQTITEVGAIAMRFHFVNMSFEANVDYLSIADESLFIKYRDTGFKEDFFSPWIYGEELNIYYFSNGTNQEYGYYIDYYEFVNDSSYYYNNTYSWGFNTVNTYGASHGSGDIGNSSGMYVILNSGFLYQSQQYYALYYKDEFSEIYQDFIVPRDKIINAYISFDYYAESCMETNNNFVYVEINKQKIYSIGGLDIVAEGKNQWHQTGKIYMPLWVNTSNIFEEVLNNQQLNLSIGIRSASSSYYGGYEDRFHQIVWFDNITLGLTAIANSSQDGINLTINYQNLFEKEQWGVSNQTLIGQWNLDPIVLTVNTTSPSLTFNLDTKLYGYRNLTSKINQQNEEGLKYEILENGSIYWEFLHNLYMPAQYSDFEFIIGKPSNWNFISVLDPTLQSRTFEKGGYGDELIKINTSEAIFPGWWTFRAISPNYLNLSTTKIVKNGVLGYNTFKTGDSIKIKTNISYNNEIPPDLSNTIVNLTIYYPNRLVWIQESVIPPLNGCVDFSQRIFSSQNMMGGIYNYKIFWSNGTTLGGMSSNFTLIHKSSINLLKPDEAKETLRIEAYLGDILPIRIYIFDSETNIAISDADLYYNWTENTWLLLEEAAPGIYEATIDTSGLSNAGTYNLVIYSSIIGFEQSILTIELIVVEESNLIFWIIISVLVIISSIFGIMSLRSYVLLPRKRRKNLALLSRTQKFKDIHNIHAIEVIHKLSGLPIFLKSYSVLEDKKKEIFSGFIQAIIAIGEELSGQRLRMEEMKEIDKSCGVEKIIELDFKHFYCLIADREETRIVFLLKEKSSERLKEQIGYLSFALCTQLSEEFEYWDGSLERFEVKIAPILNKFLDLKYRESFKLADPSTIALIRKSNEINTMETRVLNVIYSIYKGKTSFELKTILELIHEQNKDLVIDAIESLISRKILIPAPEETSNKINY